MELQGSQAALPQLPGIFIDTEILPQQTLHVGSGTHTHTEYPPQTPMQPLSLAHTPLLCEEQQQAGETFEHFSHDHSSGGKEAVPRQCAGVADAEDEGSILDHQHG